MKISINETGNYFVSGYKSSKCRTFSHEMRKTLSTGSFNTPGPGNYKLPSEFGHYQAKNIKEWFYFILYHKWSHKKSSIIISTYN